MDTYEKKYNEALERYKAFKEKYYTRDTNLGDVIFDKTGEMQKDFETIFPELRESEDERIRRELIEYLRGDLDDITTDDTDRWITWLEKQKEQKQNQSEEEREYVKTLKGLISDFIRDSGGAISDVTYYQRICDWLDERHIEQKPAEYLDKDKVYATMKKLHDLSFSQLIPINSDEYKKIDEITCDIRNFLNYPIEQNPSWSEEDENKLKQCIRIVTGWEGDYDMVKSPYSNFLKSLRPDTFQNGNSRPKTSDNWKPSEEKKKETLDGADIGYGLETAIDILENGFTHYQTDDGEYERKQALDVLIFLLNETRKKEDAKLWSKDIVESIVTWATEKLQLYSMKESTPYVEAVKNNAQKVLDWAKEQWPIYYGWKPSEEQMEALWNAYKGGKEQEPLRELIEQLKKL